MITIKNIESSRREFGKRVKERREELNMSMDELAKLMGYSHRSSIQKIESGENSIPQDKVELLFKETNKTKNSRRTIPIMIPRLKKLLNAVPKEKRTGRIYTVPQNYLWREINAVCEANGLPKIGVHGLRHSFASLAHHVGMPEQEAMLIGGWEDPGTMHRIYEHISEADRIKQENKIAQFFNSD